ncbi:MAG: Pectate lyase superfamily protein [Paenibacillaceae bacterium]|jgi:hypothetical protein|nr:Pectate lyase superfamily protein [Paenibacillaceae bacterium]
MTYSQLWGKNGEQWNAAGRLPDFSYAGYGCGNRALPEPGATANVRDFGAVGDGVQDDTAAFQAAIAQMDEGALLIPPGRYKLSGMLGLHKSRVVLRGAGAKETVLIFNRHLTDISPDWGATTTGERTSNYSWSGGLISISGDFQPVSLASIVQDAPYGGRTLHVDSAAELKPGQRIEIFQEDAADNSLADHLYTCDPGDTGKLLGSTTASLVAEIESVDGGRITISRPLRFAVRAEWKPVIRQFRPTVEEVGIEGMTLEFPHIPYSGHFRELGYNGIAITNASDCWVKDVLIRNSDCGMILKGKFCTIRNLVMESVREADAFDGCTGHHGIYIYGDDNLLEDFDYRCKFIHDLSVSKCAGNVIAGGRGMDLCFDHHKRAPYANLFTDIHAGTGSRLWKSGGGAALGRNCAARGTFWNIYTEQPQRYPEGFAPDSLNLVGYPTKEAPLCQPEGLWMEPLHADGPITPVNLYQAQLQRRLSGQG